MFDAPFHYIVLNKPEFTFNLDRINQYIAILDQIEATKGPGVMVTIGTGKKHFSTGFDLPFWVQSYDNNMKPSIYRFQNLMARLLSFSMPTMCVFNGNALAGGFILGLCHDFRIMHQTNGYICLSEAKLGLTLAYPYTAVCAAKLDAATCNRLIMAIDVKQQEALKDRLIDSTYAGPEDLAAQITAFGKRYATLGAQR